MKKHRLLMAFIFLLGYSGLGFAHSPMKSTFPADKEVLSSVPQTLNLTFAAPARVMKVVITHSTNDASHEQKLEIPSRDFVTKMQLVPKSMGPGIYAIKWRALGKDGHVLKGDFSYEVTSE